MSKFFTDEYGAGDGGLGWWGERYSSLNQDEPDLKIEPKIPESITIENQIKCPKCGFPIVKKVAFASYEKISRAKYQCLICGYIWGE